MNWDWDLDYNRELLFAMNVFNYLNPSPANRKYSKVTDFFYSELSMNTLFNNINNHLEVHFKNDFSEITNLLNEWLDKDIFVLKAEAKSKSQLNKVLELEQWINDKIYVTNETYSIPVYALMYVYLTNNGHKNIRDNYPDLNVKPAFSKFVEEKLNLKKGKNSFYIHFNKYSKKKNILCNTNIKLLKKVVSVLKNQTNLEAYNEALNDLNSLLKSTK